MEHAVIRVLKYVILLQYILNYKNDILVCKNVWKNDENSVKIVFYVFFCPKGTQCSHF